MELLNLYFYLAVALLLPRLNQKLLRAKRLFGLKVVIHYNSVRQCKNGHASYSWSLYIKSTASLPPCCVWPRRTPWANTGQLFHPHFCLLALPGSNLLLVVGPERFSSLLPVIGEDKLQSCFRKHVQLPFFLLFFILFFFAFTEDGRCSCHWMLMNHLGCFSFCLCPFLFSSATVAA